MEGRPQVPGKAALQARFFDRKASIVLRLGSAERNKIRIRPPAVRGKGIGGFRQIRSAVEGRVTRELNHWAFALSTVKRDTGDNLFYSHPCEISGRICAA